MHQCPYCNEFEKGSFEIQDKNYGNRILFESDNFIVFPSLGQIVEGYLLIASKKHYIGMGQVPHELYSELNSVHQKVRQVLSEAYESPLFFEHGPTSEKEKGGCCVTHAHFHAVPVQVDILSDLAKYFKYQKIETFDSLKKQFDKRVPYFFYESNLKEKYLFEVPEIVPSQYVRQIIAFKIGKPEKWDWKTYYGIDELLKTLEKLKDKFI